MTRSIGASMMHLLALTLLVTIIELLQVSANPIDESQAPKYPERPKNDPTIQPPPYPKTCPPPQYDFIDTATFAPNGVTCIIPELSARHPCAKFKFSRDQVANTFYFGPLQYSTDGGYVFVDSNNNNHCVTAPINGSLGPNVISTIFGHWSDGRDFGGRCRRTIRWAPEKGIAVEVTIDGIKFHGTCK